MKNSDDSTNIPIKYKFPVTLSSGADSDVHKHNLFRIVSDNRGHCALLFDSKEQINKLIKQLHFLNNVT